MCSDQHLDFHITDTRAIVSKEGSFCYDASKYPQKVKHLKHYFDGIDARTKRCQVEPSPSALSGFLFWLSSSSPSSPPSESESHSEIASTFENPARLCCVLAGIWGLEGLLPASLRRKERGLPILFAASTQDDRCVWIIDSKAKSNGLSCRAAQPSTTSARSHAFSSF